VPPSVPRAESPRRCSVLRTQGDDIEDAARNAEEALALYVEGIRENGGSLDTGVIRRKFPLPA
jgi:predicted RNase H-like HicB family nuclease